MSYSSRRGNPRPGPGQDIRTYTVDQLLAMTADPETPKTQTCRELERRARVLDGELSEDQGEDGSALS